MIIMMTMLAAEASAELRWSLMARGERSKSKSPVRIYSAYAHTSAELADDQPMIAMRCDGTSKGLWLAVWERALSSKLLAMPMLNSPHAGCQGLCSRLQAALSTSSIFGAMQRTTDTCWSLEEGVVGPWRRPGGSGGPLGGCLAWTSLPRVFLAGDQ
ncbi:hypothetical protein NFJ02_14g16850 [Pycnococcus provasolii]